MPQDEGADIRAPAPPTEKDYEMLATWMSNHWKRIAQSHELTGQDIIPLLEDEARWFQEHEFWDSFDATIDLIRQVRHHVRARDARRGN